MEKIEKYIHQNGIVEIDQLRRIYTTLIPEKYLRGIRRIDVEFAYAGEFTEFIKKTYPKLAVNCSEYEKRTNFGANLSELALSNIMSKLVLNRIFNNAIDVEKETKLTAMSSKSKEGRQYWGSLLEGRTMFIIDQQNNGYHQIIEFLENKYTTELPENRAEREREEAEEKAEKEKIEKEKREIRSILDDMD